ncbi:MAG: hypothetical protein PUC12_03640 [Clostridiales bacterium]|nr:hypothetical protein [Clostridiales bacterium]
MRHLLIDNHQLDPTKCSFGLPWKNDAICFNFRGPEEMILADRLDSLGDLSEIETLVIGCELDDYAFIAGMTNLQQLYIYTAANMSSLDFVENLIRLRQMYIANSHVARLDSLFKLLAEKKRLLDEQNDIHNRIAYIIEGICIESDADLDGKELLTPRLYMSELIINKRHIR